jgi:hypothetical protein
MDANEFPGNSKRVTAEPARTEKIVERVISHTAVTQKKSLGRRLRNMLIGDNSTSVLQYVVIEVVVPQVKELISEMLQQGLERTLYGESRSAHRRPGSRPASSHTPYNRYSDRSSRPLSRPTRDDRPIGSVQPRSIDDIRLATRVEADTVIHHMYDLLDEYGMVCVGDVMTLVGLTSSPIDQKWGWDDLTTAKIRRVNGGYVLELPPTIPLD